MCYKSVKFNSMGNLIRILTFGVSAFEGLFGVFFASFSGWGDLSNSGRWNRPFYFGKVELATLNNYLCIR
jgi:hypothetical protein